MDKVLAWVFGVVGLLLTLVVGYLWLMDGGLVGELSARDAELQKYPDRDQILIGWDHRIAQIAALPVSVQDALPKGELTDHALDVLRSKLPAPRDAARSIEDGVEKVKEKLPGN